MPTAYDELTQAWTDWQSANLIKKWRQANPREAAALDAYRAGGPRPTMVTPTGKALVEETAAWFLTKVEPPPPPPPTTDKLTWAPPGYVGGDPHDAASYPNFKVIEFNDSTRIQRVPYGGAVDVFFKATSKFSQQPYFYGFRHVVSIGVEVEQNTINENGSQMHGCTGIVHLEGWWVHGDGLRDGLGISSSDATLQLQNYRSGPTHTFGNYHGDCVQLWGQDTGEPYKPGIKDFRVDRFTGYSDLQVLFLGNHDGCLKSADIRRADLIGVGPGGGGQLLYKHARKDYVCGWDSIMNLEDVYMEQRCDPGTTSWTTPDNWVVPNANGTYWGATPDLTRAAKIGQDAQGQYVYWVDSADVKGIVRVGPRPGGEIVPVSKVTFGAYKSPGYV